MKDLETKLKELPQLCIDEKTDDANMMSSKRLGSQRPQVRPSSAADAEEEGCSSSYDYRPKSKRDATSSSRRASRCIDNKTGPHRRTATNDADIKLVNDRDRDHLQHQLKQHRHHHELQQQQRSSTRRRPSAEEQSFSNSIETTSTHPSTSYEDYLIADDEEVYYDHHDEDDGYYGHHGKSCSSTSRSNTSRSLARRRRGSRSPSTSRSSSRLSSSNNHHRRHHDYHSSSSSPSRNSSRRLPPLPRRRPSPEDGLRSSFGSNSHDSHRSSRTLPSSYHDKPRDARPPIRRRSSDDLCALESNNSSRRSISRYHHHHDRRRREGCSHRSLSSSSSRRDYSRDSEDHDDPSVNTAVKLRVSSRSSSRQHLKDSSNSRRIIHDDDKTPRKHNHTTNNKKNNNNNNNKKNSIDLTIDSNGQGTFTVTSSPSTAPLQFDIQIDEHHSSYLIQTSLGLLHQIRSVHSSKNTNILRTLSHWNSYYEGKEKQNGYCRGQLGIVSMSPSSFTTKHDVVLMTLTGSYHHGSSSSPSSSFEDDDVFIKELELFVTDSLWCYLRLHGLVEEEEDGRGSDYLGNSDHHEECDQVRNLRAEFHNKNGRKKERVLSRVFKRVIGE